MARISLTALLLAGLAAAAFAQQPRGEKARERTDAALGFACPGGESDQLRPEVKTFLGDVTKKARVLPKPEYPRAKRTGMSGVVRAEVVIDIHSGKVVWARIVSGHPLFRQAVKDVVCRAEFYPAFINSRPIRVGGTIAYKFRRR